MGDRRGEGSEMSGSGREEGPTPLADALGAFLRKKGLDRELKGQELLGRWNEVVGERIAGVAQPSGVARGVLYVEVRSSAWMSELNLMKSELLRRLNAGAGEGRVERIVFRLAEDPGASP